MNKRHVELRAVYIENLNVYNNMKQKYNELDATLKNMKGLMFDFFNVWNEHPELRDSLKTTKNYICYNYKSTKYLRNFVITQIKILKSDLKFYHTLLSKY